MKKIVFFIHGERRQNFYRNQKSKAKLKNWSIFRIIGTVSFAGKNLTKMLVNTGEWSKNTILIAH